MARDRRAGRAARRPAAHPPGRGPRRGHVRGRARSAAAPIDHFESVGWMTDRTWVAHCIYPNDAEVARLGGAGVGVAHCPSSNMMIGGGGIAPVARAAGRRRHRSGSAATAPRPPTPRRSGWRPATRCCSAGCAAARHRPARGTRWRSRPGAAPGAWAAPARSASCRSAPLATSSCWPLDGHRARRRDQRPDRGVAAVRTLAARAHRRRGRGGGLRRRPCRRPRRRDARVAPPRRGAVPGPARFERGGHREERFVHPVCREQPETRPASPRP